MAWGENIPDRRPGKVSSRRESRVFVTDRLSGENSRVSDRTGGNRGGAHAARGCERGGGDGERGRRRTKEISGLCGEGSGRIGKPWRVEELSEAKATRVHG